jgi:integrase
MGLGTLDRVSIDAARSEAERWRKVRREGRDPMEERAKEKDAQTIRQAREKPFSEVAVLYIADREDAWTSEKSADQWRSSLAMYAYPIIGNKPISQISTDHLLKILKPIWIKKPETASRVRGRIEAILDYAKALGWREEENPARWRGQLQNLLPPQAREQKHYPALPWKQVPAFVADLRSREGSGARALEFLLLTVARSGMVLKARWKEFDLDQRIWNVPAIHMKKRKPFRIPLSDAAMRLLHALSPKQQQPNGHVFCTHGDKPLSNMTLTMLMRRMSDAGDGAPPCYADEETGEVAVPHGLRSSFRDWCGDATAYPREHAEAAMAHKVGSKVEAAYRRGFALEIHRCMLQDWANFCERGLEAQAWQNPFGGQSAPGSWVAGFAAGLPPNLIALLLQALGPLAGGFLPPVPPQPSGQDK